MIGRALPTIDDKAAAWAARVLSGEMSEAEQGMLDEWLAADARHEKAYLEYADVITSVDRAGTSLAEGNLERELEQFTNERTSRVSWFVAAPAMAASIAAAAFFFNVMTRTAPDAVRYATAHGEAAVFALADGSSVSLNTDSEVEVIYGAENRKVLLIKGEALFDVVRDRSRPFIVTSQRVEAVVLGTRFNVHAAENETTVSVLSGVVEVDAVQDGAPLNVAAVTLIAGQEVSVDESGAHEAVHPFNPDAVTSWRRGEAYYENEPLSAVLHDLNRYYSIELRPGNDSVGDIPVTGRFDLQNQAVTIEALSVALSLHTEPIATDTLVFLPNE